MSGCASGGKGHVRIPASAAAISQFLPADLATFATLAPQVVIALQERFSSEIVQALREGATAITRLLVDQSAVARKPLRTRIQVNSFAALCKMVEAGLGSGILPEGLRTVRCCKATSHCRAERPVGETP